MADNAKDSVDRKRSGIVVPDEVVVAVRRMVAAGAKQSDVAQLFGLSPTYVCRVAGGRSRYHVEGPIRTPKPYRKVRS
jgi:hypothetical protein